MDVDLRSWAEAHAAAGMVQAKQVLELIEEHATLKRLNEDLAERVAAQSESLSKNAEKTTVHGVLNESSDV